MPPDEKSYLSRKRSKLAKKFNRAFRHWVLRDTFPAEIRRWFKDEGDDTLRLDYELDENTIVFDVGGYRGDFAQKISDRFHCYVYVFEPNGSFHESCISRFSGNTKIRCFNFGLGHCNGDVFLSDAEDASSTKQIQDEGQGHTVKIRQFSEVIHELGIEKIDLVKVNIEGGEFDLLPHIVSSNLINRIDRIQIQFHNFIENAYKMRKVIRKDLSKTHKCDWCYTFVWEGWSKK